MRPENQRRRGPVRGSGARVAALPAILALAVTACAGSPASAPAAGTSAVTPAPVSLTIYAAASLTAPLARIVTAYESAHPGMTLAISTDSSSALATKIEQGAPADVFLSADTSNPQKLADKGFTAGAMTVFAGNLLAVVVPEGSRAGITTPLDLARVGVKIVACADSVPIAKYTAQVIANLGRQPGYPADFAARYAANVVSKETNVAAILTKVKLGEGDAGIVYLTDALASDRTRMVALPDSANVAASYGGVIVRFSRSPVAASAFMAWLVGADGQAILSSFGFQPPA